MVTWVEIGQKPWPLFGFPEIDPGVEVMQFWYARLHDFLSVRQAVRAALEKDPTLAESRLRERFDAVYNEVELQDGEW